MFVHVGISTEAADGHTMSCSEQLSSGLEPFLRVYSRRALPSWNAARGPRAVKW